MSSRFLDPGSIPLKRPPQGNIWTVLNQITMVLIVLGVFAGIFVCFLPVIQKTQKMQMRKEENQVRMDESGVLNRRLQEEFELLKTNPQYNERIAWDKLNMGRPGETIFRFDPYDQQAKDAPGISKNRP
jgi:cell division protein DivIC